MLRYVLRSQLSNSLFFRLFTFSIHASHVQTYVTHLEGCMESQTYVHQRQVGRPRVWLMACISFLSETVGSLPKMSSRCKYFLADFFHSLAPSRRAVQFTQSQTGGTIPRDVVGREVKLIFYRTLIPRSKTLIYTYLHTVHFLITWGMHLGADCGPGH